METIVRTYMLSNDAEYIDNDLRCPICGAFNSITNPNAGCDHRLATIDNSGGTVSYAPKGFEDRAEYKMIEVFIDPDNYPAVCDYRVEIMFYGKTDDEFE